MFLTLLLVGIFSVPSSWAQELRALYRFDATEYSYQEKFSFYELYAEPAMGTNDEAVAYYPIHVKGGAMIKKIDAAVVNNMGGIDRATLTIALVSHPLTSGQTDDFTVIGSISPSTLSESVQTISLNNLSTVVEPGTLYYLRVSWSNTYDSPTGYQAGCYFYGAAVLGDEH